jgi:soluble lytic murein transglycosylase-like protein
MRKKWFLTTVTIVISVSLIVAGIYFTVKPTGNAPHRETSSPAKPAAPPDLEKLRGTYTSGLEALDLHHGEIAVRQFESISFGSRRVEEYRLYFLAKGFELEGDRSAERLTLAALAARTPKLAVWNDGAATLAGLYAELGDWRESSSVSGDLARRSDIPNTAAAARWQTLEASLCGGDVAAAYGAAREIAIEEPRSPLAAPALAVVRAIEGIGENGAIRLTPEERLERGVTLLRDGDPQSSLDELTALAPSAPAELREPINLNRGLALFQMHRFDDAIKQLEPLSSHAYRVAIPALYHVSKSYIALANAINPIVLKTVIQRRQVGTIRVRQGKKFVRKPKYARVRTTVQLVDLAKKSKKEGYERLAIERLKDLLTLPLDEPMRIEVLDALIGFAEAKNEDAYEQDLVGRLVAIDPHSDPGLQHFWDKAWSAYNRGDLTAAKPLFDFIRQTYASPNVKRQAAYWYARTVERAGDKTGALTIYRQLARAPYDDVYALDAHARGAPRPPLPPNPLKINRPDWRELAERTMPAELRLAYELTALSDMRNALREIQKNVSRANQPFADALMADLYHSSDDTELMYRTIRRAFPTLATVEQDSVPPYFLRMYYPVKYEKAIRRDADRSGVDPYLIMALCLQESYYNPKARSPAGALGLMQIMPATGKELGRRLHGVLSITHLENPETNIEIGTFYFQQLQALFGGNWQLAVAAYNAGRGNVAKWHRAAAGQPQDEFLESIPFPETRNYVKRVTLLSSTYRRINQ